MVNKMLPFFSSVISAILLKFVFSCQGYLPVPKKRVPLFVFGNSIIDPRNNNFINTIYKANYYPYGETLFKNPTGRFSDGRIIPDFIVCEIAVDSACLQPENNDFSYGVNFASAGGGALVETNQGLTIDLGAQLRYIKNVTWELRQKLGDEEAQDLLSRAVYLFSIGSNDYISPFNVNSTVLESYSHQEYVGLVIGNISSVIQKIYKTGGRKFGFVNLWPLACVPYLRAFDVEKHGACLDRITPCIQLHNKEISELLPRLQNELKEFRYSLIDFYSFLKARRITLINMVLRKEKWLAFGSGPYRGILSGGGNSGVTKYFLCDNPSDHVFFDSGHLTERAYQQFPEQAWTGEPSFAGLFNLKALFEFI